MCSSSELIRENSWNNRAVVYVVSTTRYKTENRNSLISTTKVDDVYMDQQVHEEVAPLRKKKQQWRSVVFI